MSITWTPLPKKLDSQWVLQQSAWPWLQLQNVNFDTTQLTEEAESLIQHFVPYKDELSKGWSVFNVGGPLELWDVDIVDHSPELKIFNSVLKADSCIVKFIQNFKAVKITAAQILCFEPAGQVNWHRDKQLRRLDRLVLPFNNPAGAQVEFEDWGAIPYQGGGLFLIDTSWRHRAFNNSNIRRFHLQLTFQYTSMSEEFKSQVLLSAQNWGAQLENK
jgi:hypothetical protein